MGMSVLTDSQTDDDEVDTALPQTTSDAQLQRRTSALNTRVLWKKSILQTMLLIRMKKKIKQLQSAGNLKISSAKYNIQYKSLVFRTK